MTTLESLLYNALKSYPCRCTYARTPNGQPVFEKGERVLEKQCLHCVAIAAYDSANG
jgi:hypothetical protein